METLVLKNAMVFDGVNPDPHVGGCVVLEGEEIKDIVAKPPALKDAEVLDCDGRWVLPGLIDAHVHIGAVDHNSHGQHRRHSMAYLALRIAERLKIILENGFTTVRDGGGADYGFKQAITEGLIPGPRLLISGRPLSQTGGSGDWRTRFEPGDYYYEGEFGMTHVIADGIDEVRKAAREQIRRGADVIKVMASGGAVSPTGRIDTSQYSVGELTAAVEEAEASGHYVMAHALSPSAIRNCVAAGVRSIEHGNFLDAETARLIAEHGRYLVPTLLAYEYDAEHGEEYGYSPEVCDKLAMGAARGRDGLRSALAAGVTVGSGSDMIGDLVWIMGSEIALKAEVMGAQAAIIATTRVNAELCGVGDQVGTIERGKLADLIVVDGNPLDSPELLGKREAVNTVIKGGKVVRTRLR